MFNTQEETPKELQNRIVEISSLPDNWDGYGAPKIDSKIINNAIELLKKIKIKPDSITPTPRGCISLEWNEIDDENYIYIEIDEKNIGFYCVNKTLGKFNKNFRINEINDNQINFIISQYISDEANFDKIPINNYKIKKPYEPYEQCVIYQYA